MKIAIIGPYPHRSGGIADYTLKLVHTLRTQDKTDVCVVSFKKDGISEPNQFPLISFNPWLCIKLRRLLIKDNFDIIHVQFDLSNFMLLSVPLLFILGTLPKHQRPVLTITYHEARRELELWGKVSRIFYWIFNKLFDRIFTHSNVSLESLRDIYKLPESKLRCIPHGTYEFNNRSNLRVELSKKYKVNNRKVVLFFGYIYKTKGIEYLIEAIAKMKEADNDLPIVLIAGEVPSRTGLLRFFQRRNEMYLSHLKDLIIKYDLGDSISFTGFIKNKYIYSLFKLADVVVLPYTSIDQSGVLNIAIAVPTPVLASRIGGVAETLHDVGVTFEPKSAQAIAVALKDFLGNTEKLKSIKNSYINLSKEISTKNVALLLRQNYEDLLFEKRQPIIYELSSFYPPHLGGQELFVEQLSAKLYEKGLKIRIICSSTGYNHKNQMVESNKIKVTRLSSFEFGHSPIMPTLPYHLLKIPKIAIAHVHTGQAYLPEITLLVSKIKGFKYVAHVHLMIRPTGRMGFLLPFYKRYVFGYFLRNATKVVCLTYAMKKEIINEYHLDRNNVVVIANGVTEELVKSIPRTKSKDQDILFVGRLSKQKNIPILLKVMKRLPDYRLTIVGEGEEYESLRNLENKLGLRNVNFRGRLTHAEVIELMVNSKVLVLPSLYEGMPLTILEGLMAGIPIIASDIPEVRELAGSSCRLVNPDDINAWHEAIGAMLNSSALRKRYMKAGLIRAQTFSWDLIIDQWYELFTNLKKKITQNG